VVTIDRFDCIQFIQLNDNLQLKLLSLFATYIFCVVRAQPTEVAGLWVDKLLSNLAGVDGQHVGVDHPRVLVHQVTLRALEDGLVV
jgi:hypothetical protein